MFGLRQLRFWRMAFWRYGGSLALALVVMCQPGWARTNVSDWKNVEALAPGSGIWVRTAAGNKYHGKLVEVTDDMLSFDSDEPHFPGRMWVQRRVPREDVKEVRRLSPWVSTAVGAGIGLAIGVGIGAAIDSRAPVTTDDPHLGTFVFGMLGTILGSAAASHSTLIKGKTVYRAS